MAERTFLKLQAWQKVWLVVALAYGAAVVYMAVEEHDYIYESKHYANVIIEMDKEGRDIYFRQKCNSLDSTATTLEPECYSLATIDDGTMNFDITTPRSEAEIAQKAYNEAAFNFVVIATTKFVGKYLLIWIIPAVILYIAALALNLGYEDFKNRDRQE